MPVQFDTGHAGFCFHQMGFRVKYPDLTVLHIGISDPNLSSVQSLPTSPLTSWKSVALAPLGTNCEVMYNVGIASKNPWLDELNVQQHRLDADMDIN